MKGYRFSMMIVFAVVLLCLTALAHADSKPPSEETSADNDWCLMAFEPKRVQPSCIRTFTSYGWCMFDLRTMVDEYALVPIKFSCHKESVWRSIVRKHP